MRHSTVPFTLTLVWKKTLGGMSVGCRFGMSILKRKTPPS
jgi:hypothetical protein